MASFVTAGWVASSHGTEQYLQVDFEAIYDVTALEFTRATLGYGTRKLRYILHVHVHEHQPSKR